MNATLEMCGPSTYFTLFLVRCMCNPVWFVCFDFSSSSGFYSLSSTGDMVVELVDGDFDDDNDDAVDEQSIGNEIRDLPENLL